MAGFGGALLLAGLGTLVISSWVLPWAIAGIALAAAYAVEWPRPLHTDLGFAAAWGAFPILVGFWSQTESLNGAAVLGALAATVVSLAQRKLSTPARYVRRAARSARVEFAAEHRWGRERLLATWELPLKLLTGTVVVFAGSLLVGCHYSRAGPSASLLPQGHRAPGGPRGSIEQGGTRRCG